MSNCDFDSQCHEIAAEVIKLRQENASLLAENTIQWRELETDRDKLQANLNRVVEQWKDSQHEIKLLKMALKAANNGNDTDDLRYAYEPGKGIDQLRTVCNGVIVHIPVDWFIEIVDDLTARTEQTETHTKLLYDMALPLYLKLQKISATLLTENERRLYAVVQAITAEVEKT